MSIALIELINCSKKYININFDFTIYQGETILIIGKNGSGKTTLFNLIMGYIKPDSGLILKNKLRISYLPEVVSLPLYMNVGEYLEYTAKIKSVYLDYELINKLKIPLNKKMYQLSKGLRQKIALTTTLLGKQDIVILDEPLSGLDQHSTDVLIAEIKKLQLKNNTILISTHQPVHFENVVTRHIHL